MCTSLLYHTFGIRGYEYVRTEYQGGQVIFTINQDLKTRRCSACGAREVRPRGRVERRFRALPIGSRVTTLVRPIPRVQCLACGVVRQVEIPFAESEGRTTGGGARPTTAQPELQGCASDDIQAYGTDS